MTNISLALEQNQTLENYIIIQSPPMVARFYLWGYLVLFILGFTGNIASLLTFTRPRLRSVSTGALFIVLAISDTLFLFASIFDFIDFGLQVDFDFDSSFDLSLIHRFHSMDMSTTIFYVVIVCFLFPWLKFVQHGYL